MRAAWIAKRFDGKASQFFGLLPRARFTIKPVPEDLAPFYTAGRGGPGLYLLNTYDLPSRPLYNLIALTLHESAPGHAFQMPLALEHKHQPEFRQHTYLSAYGEGWALYCERLGLEMGMYETPYDRFGMLNYQIWRAARLVVDTGIHSQGWSRDRAIAYLREYTALPGTRNRNGSRSLHRLARTSVVLLSGGGRDSSGSLQGGTGARCALQSARLPRHGAGTRIRAAAGTDGAHRSVHRRGRQRPVPGVGVGAWRASTSVLRTALRDDREGSRRSIGSSGKMTIG